MHTGQLIENIYRGDVYTNEQIKSVDELLHSIKYDKVDIDRSVVQITFDNPKSFFDSFFHVNKYEAENIVNIEGGHIETGSVSDFIYNMFKYGTFSNECLNDENKKLCKRVGLIMNLDVNTSDFYRMINKKFPRDYNGIVDEVDSYYIDLVLKSENREIIEEFSDKFILFGIIELVFSKTYLTTLKNLNNLFKKYPDVENIKDLLGIITSDLHIGDWTPLRDYTEVLISNTPLNSEYTQENINYYLDRIFDTVTEDFNEDNFNFLRGIESLFDKNKINISTYNHSSINDDIFIITDIDFDDNKIVIELNKRGQLQSYTLDEFNTFLNQPRLF
jgi:hypothetical protein